VTDLRRNIPAVDRLLASEAFAHLLAREPRHLVVLAVQQVQAELRTLIAAGGAQDGDKYSPDWYAQQTDVVLARIRRPSLRPVINATGVVLHTNLGRAPLADVARRAVERAMHGYSNLEFDLGMGTRGSRYVHCVDLLTRLTGAESALVVNNNAAALVLALNTLALGRGAVISRGELVEIGGSFRVPEIMARSGARMREVGSTNRTNVADYRGALDSESAVILKVHPSNFRIAGFTAETTIEELAELAREHDAVLIHDLGSGLLLAAASLGLPPEPTPMESLRAGADVVTMSGDKLLGGPQAGIILGRADLVARMRQNPLCRALRVDKMTLAALEATLTLYLDPERAKQEIPTLRMLSMTVAEIGARADRLAAALRADAIAADVIDGGSAVGGGAFPTLTLPTRLVRITPSAGAAGRIEQRLRETEPPVVARIQDNSLLLDPRTILPEEDALVLSALRSSVAGNAT
jgi:L-seryl-tRNA(Ser) seleniumtransferase